MFEAVTYKLDNPELWTDSALEFQITHSMNLSGRSSFSEFQAFYQWVRPTGQAIWLIFEANIIAQPYDSYMKCLVMANHTLTAGDKIGVL